MPHNVPVLTVIREGLDEKETVLVRCAIHTGPDIVITTVSLKADAAGLYLVVYVPVIMEFVRIAKGQRLILEVS
jgi:hypothetical protein